MKKTTEDLLSKNRYAIICGMLFIEQILLFVQTRGKDPRQKSVILSDALVDSIIGIASILIVLLMLVAIRFISMLTPPDKKFGFLQKSKNRPFQLIFIGCIVLFVLNAVVHLIFIICGEEFSHLYYFMIPGIAFYVSVLLYQEK